MSLSTLRRRENSRARELTPDGRAPGEDQAQGARAPHRGEGRRLEIGGAGRRLEALLEEERTRAASVPVAGVRRLRLEDGRDQTRALDDGGREAAGRGAQGGPIGTLDDGARAMGLGQRQGGPMEALDDPRARAMGLGQLQEQSYEVSSTSSWTDTAGTRATRSPSSRQ